MKKLTGREIGKCARCLKKLLLNPENDLCINCENEAQREKIAELELCLAQCRREKSQVYTTLINERKQRGVE